MKKILTLIIMILCATVLFAQAPEKFTYQAVVRNASNQLVANAPVGVRISLLQGGVNGTLVYMETQTAITNTNGLVTLQIGGGTVQQGAFADIDWANGPFFLKTEIDPNGGSNYSVTSTQQLLSVPYAIYAKEAGNGFGGDYNDLINKPTIPQNVGELTNDAGYITMDSVPTVPSNVSAFTNDAGYITAQDIPEIPTVPTNVSAFVNDVPYMTSFTEQQILTISNDTIFLTGGSFVKLPEGFNGDYNSLTNTPAIPTVPTNVSAFVNDMGYLTSFTEQQVLSISNDTIFLTGGSFVKLPVGFDGDYNSLSNKPELFSGDYNDLANQPTIPTIPTDVSVFNNDAGYITMDSVPTIPSNVSAFTNDAGYITSADVQQAAGIPTMVSAFQNDAGYITAAQIPVQVNADWNATSGAAKILNKPTLFSGNYNDLTNKPTIPTVPTNISAFVNDMGYITAIPDSLGGISIETDPIFSAWDKDYNDLTNKPTIPTVPTNVSAFTNDSGYLTGYTETDPTVPSWAKEATKPAYDYSEITGTPTIPTVNDGTLTIQKNGVTVGTFTSNQMGTSTVNIQITAQDIIDAVNGMTDAEKAALCSALNCGGGGGGEEPAVFTCGTSKMVDAEGNEYETVLIGTQCWTKTNLRVAPAGATDETSSGAYSYTEPYYYDNSGHSLPLVTRGYLYNWEAAKLVCPAGWHLPSDAEWTTMEATQTSMDVMGSGWRGDHAGKLAGDGWNSSTTAGAPGNVTDADHNASGFSAVPAGSWGHGFHNVGDVAYFWSSTEGGASRALSRALSYYHADVARYNDHCTNGFSVRCLRD